MPALRFAGRHNQGTPMIDTLDDMIDTFDGTDETLALDGSRCPSCKGTIVAEPVEAHHSARLRCRDCGERTNR